MRLLTICLSIAAFRILAPLPAHAAQTAAASKTAPAAKPATASAPDPKKVAFIEDIFRLTKPEAMVDQMLTQYKMAFQQGASQGFGQEVRKYGDPAKFQPEFTRFENQVFTLLASRLEWKKLKPQFVQVYSDTFSADELSGMDSFYKSSSGQALINKMPSLLAKCAQIGQQQMNGVGPEIQKMMSNLMADVKKHSESAQPKPPAK